VKPEDIGRMQPEDRFHVHGIRVIVDRNDWPRGLRWLQRLIELYQPPIPRGSIFTMTVNGNVVVKVPLHALGLLGRSGPSVGAAFANKLLVLSRADSFACGVTYQKSIRLGAVPVRVMVDGYFYRGPDGIPEVIYARSESNPEGK